MEDLIIKLEDVSKSFKVGESQVIAVSNVNLSIPKGKIVALMGPSGSGKSTLLNIIGALDTPDSGRIEVAGKDLSKLSPDDRARFRNQTCGFIFQNFNLIPVLTALENVLLPTQLSQTHQADSERRALELLDLVGLSEQSHQLVNRLSGGQMQRVAIARALVNKPEVIFADEPTANLDQETSDKILTLIREIRDTQNTSVVMATHDSEVLPYCDLIIKLRDGKLREEKLIAS